MEARVEARRKRVKLAEEMRRQKLEEQKRKEEAARIEEEQRKRRLQQEVRLYKRSKYINVILRAIGFNFTSETLLLFLVTQFFYIIILDANFFKTMP